MGSATRPPAAFLLAAFILVAAGGAAMYAVKGFRTSAAAAPVQPQDETAATLRRAITAGDIPALRAAKADLNAQYHFIESGNRLLTPLAFAATLPNESMVRALLAAGAKADAPSENGLTPLMAACARADAPTITLLLEAGCPVNAQDKWGTTALMLAAKSGSTPNVRALLAAHADVHLADAEGATALWHAAGGSADSITLLIDAGARPDIPNKACITPLMHAAESGDRARCFALLNAGALPTLKDSQGRTAADWAAQRADEAGARCAALLATAGG